MHELVTDAAAVGALQELHHLPRRRCFESQDAVYVHRPIEIDVVKSVKIRVELRESRSRAEPERIEIGGEMTDDAIGTHELDGSDGFPRGGTGIDCCGGSAVRWPKARQCADEIGIVALHARPQAWAGVGGRTEHRGLAITETGEEGLPARIDGIRILQITRVQFFNERGICAPEEGCRLENRVRVAQPVL